MILIVNAMIIKAREATYHHLALLMSNKKNKSFRSQLLKFLEYKNCQKQK
jgi:hypothetical protein